VELFILALTVVYLCRDPAGTIKAAADYKRAQIAREQARAARPGHRALRRYLGTVWQAQWDQACQRYPERMKAAQARRAKRAAKRKAVWEEAQARAGERWDARFPRPADTGPAAAPKTPTAPEPADGASPAPEEAGEAGGAAAPVVDLDEARRRRAERLDDKESPAPQAAAPASETSEPPLASGAVPSFLLEEADPVRSPGSTDQSAEQSDDQLDGAPPEAPSSADTTTTQEGELMPLVLSDAASLGAHLAALRSYADYWDDVCAAKERLAAGMRMADMGEATVAAVDASREASRHAAELARAAATALEDANAPVAEARAGSPDAADGTYYERR